MIKRKISVTQNLKIENIFNSKGWNTEIKPYSLYSNYIQRVSILPEDTKDLFFELTERFENISSIEQISSLFRDGYSKIDKHEIDKARKIYFLPLIAQKLGYENWTKYKFINQFLAFLNLNKKVYKERPEMKSCDKMISFLEIEYRDMYCSDKFLFPKKFSSFKKQFNKHCDLIILVDDFIGTGKTAEEVLKFFIDDEKMMYKNNIKILSLISQNRGITHIKEKYDTDVFSGLTQDLSITNYYGQEVEIKKQLVEKMSKIIKIKKDFFGFEDSEALVCILNKSPNNTLPVFWHETKSNPAPFPRMKVYNNQNQPI